MKRISFVMVAVMGLGAIVGLDRVLGQAPKEAPKKLPNCPVMDEPISFAVSVRTDDGPVYFCCSECIKKYQANPTKYAEKVAAQRKVLADWPKVQTACPVTGEPVKADVTADHGGKKVQFCCKGCVEKFQKEPDKYKANLANSYTFQSKCPVTGEDIDPTAFAKAANGQNVYFCCKNCVKKYTADPAKFASKLAEQGFVIEAEEVKKDGSGK